MENASKALLIAGAILIAIVLISLGVMILGQGSDLVKNANMSDAEISTYNNEFSSFIGTNVRGSVVKQMISKVNSHNLANKSDVSKQISTYNGLPGKTIKDGTDEKKIVNQVTEPSIGSGYSYTVKAFKSTGGLINRIYVNKN